MGGRVYGYIRQHHLGLVAIFIALSGTAWAAATVGPKDIERNAVLSKHVKDNNLGGRDIAEATLDQVPSASNALSAQTAESANTATSAQNANLLDDLNSTDFLRSNAQAGGDLAGSYPNPDVAANAVGSNEVGPNALLGGDIDESTLLFNPSLALGAGSPGDTAAIATTASEDVTITRDSDGDSASDEFSIFDGPIEQLRINSGDEAQASFDGTAVSNGIDYSEAFHAADPQLEAGDVVSISGAGAGYVERAGGGYDPLAIGVIAEKPGFLTGASFDAERQVAPRLARLRRVASLDGDSQAERRYADLLRQRMARELRPVALAGRVPVKVDGRFGRIRLGDPLTASRIPGVAMAARRPGRVIGTALEPFSGERSGKIEMFVERAQRGAAAATKIERLRDRLRALERAVATLPGKP